MGDVEFQGGSIGRALAEKKNCLGPNLGRFLRDSHQGVQIGTPKQRHDRTGVKAGDQNA